MSKRILSIDDDEAVRKTFILAFEDTGYQIDTAESGLTGIEMYQKNRHDLIFLDLHMPGIDGVETLRRLRKINNRVPVYVVTGFYKEFLDPLKNAEKDGIHFEVIKKPVGADQIVLVAQGVLEGPLAY